MVSLGFPIRERLSLTFTGEGRRFSVSCSGKAILQSFCSGARGGRECQHGQFLCRKSAPLAGNQSWMLLDFLRRVSSSLGVGLPEFALFGPPYSGTLRLRGRRCSDRRLHSLAPSGVAPTSEPQSLCKLPKIAKPSSHIAMRKAFASLSGISRLSGALVNVCVCAKVTRL
jgi:hypothetical protein